VATGEEGDRLGVLEDAQMGSFVARGGSHDLPLLLRHQMSKARETGTLGGILFSKHSPSGTIQQWGNLWPLSRHSFMNARVRASTRLSDQ
jgi:hypothetical protein